MRNLQRCGACGEFQNISSDELKLCTQQEIENAGLIHCGCENYQEKRYVTRDMAIDAGDLSLEGAEL